MTNNIYLGFDFGLKRIGVAVGQTLTKTATPLAILAAKNGTPNWDEVNKLIIKWQPQALIVGIPLSMTDEELSVTPAATEFAARLFEKYHLPVHKVDERLTTKAAREKIFEERGYKGLQTEPIDSVAAQLMVETWMREQKDRNNE
jgi:putative holliday junction resolvase